MAHSRMPWNSSYYPSSMSHLPAVVRAKAIEIANALLEEGYEEGRAIRIAIAKAKEWSARRGSASRGMGASAPAEGSRVK